MTSMIRLFLRDLQYHWKGFLALIAAACLICAILTSAFLIGDSVRGTLMDHVMKNASVARFRQNFPIPVTASIQNGKGLLHVKGFTAGGIPVEIYALPDSTEKNHDSISGREAWGSPALAKKLNLENGDITPVRVQTLSAIQSESPMGRPPELKQTPFVWRGEYTGAESEINFDDPQLPPYNLFVTREALAQALDIPENSVNEVWFQDTPALSDDVLWELSGLTLADWEGRPVLKCRSFFLPESISDAVPEQSVKILTLFVDSLTDGKTNLSYCFAGAFSDPPFAVARNHIRISSALQKNFSGAADLSYYVADSFRAIQQKNISFAQVETIDDAIVTDALSPEIPGLTDSSACSDWEAALPIDFDRITDDDETYWNEYKSKPKIYLNFEQAQEMFAPGKCTAVLFPAGYTAERVKLDVLKILRTMPEYTRFDSVSDSSEEKVAHGVPFAPLFLGLSFFLIVSALLMLAMLLKLHIQDRSSELTLLSEYLPLKRIRRLLLMEFAAVLVPGMLFGLFIGSLLCRLQIFLLEHAWNGIVLMEHIDFHGQPFSCFIAFSVSVICAWIVVVLAVNRSRIIGNKLCLPHSIVMKSVWHIGALSCLRLGRQNMLCASLLILGYLGTLGVGAFGIKSRGEDAFGYTYVAQTLLPVIPEYDSPFPKGGLPVRIHAADRADCSNLLLASTPTVYGVDWERLTGDPSFLADGSAAVDSGSLIWILQKKKHDVISYENGSLSLDRILKASVFQGGIAANLKNFEKLFPENEGAQFFLIKSESDVPEWRKYLEPYGLELCSTDEFMSRAEHFQNRYLSIFLQLGLLGALLGFGAFVLLIMRNLRSRRNEIILLSEIGWSRKMLVKQYFMENLCLFSGSALISLLLLLLLAVFASLNLPVLLAGFLFLSVSGILMMFGMIESYFSSMK